MVTKATVRLPAGTAKSAGTAKTAQPETAATAKTEIKNQCTRTQRTSTGTTAMPREKGLFVTNKECCEKCYHNQNTMQGPHEEASSSLPLGSACLHRQRGQRCWGREKGHDRGKARGLRHVLLAAAEARGDYY